MSKPSAKNNGKLQKVQAVRQSGPEPGGLADLSAEWDNLGQVLGVDLEQLAYTTGALVRKRKVASAHDLIRIVLAYALWDWSFQLVGAWATTLGLGSLSGVAIRRRVRQSHDLLSQLLGQWLSRARQPLVGRALRVRLIDGTVITRPGSTGVDWRVHVGFDVGAQRLDQFEITDAQGGETLARHAVARGEVLVGDRIYGQRNGLGAVLAAGAQVVVRINGSSLPMETAAGQPLDLGRWLRQIPKTDQQQTRLVWITAPQGRYALRLVARRLPPAAAAAARRRAVQASRKQKHKPTALTRRMAGWVVLVSNLPVDNWSPTQILALYRLRWQVELLIKRCKSLLQLDHLRAQDPQVAQVYLLAKALGVLLLHNGLRAETQAVAEWFDDTERPLSPWRWTAFWWAHLCSMVRGQLTLPMIQAALPQLGRYLRDAPRKRRQQLASARHWLSALIAAPAQPSPTLA